jgi:hypothetical protein
MRNDRFKKKFFEKLKKAPREFEFEKLRRRIPEAQKMF